MVVTLSDAFDGQRFHRTVRTPGLADDYARHQFGDLVSAGLVHSFAGPSPGKPKTFDYDP